MIIGNGNIIRLSIDAQSDNNLIYVVLPVYLDFIYRSDLVLKCFVPVVTCLEPVLTCLKPVLMCLVPVLTCLLPVSARSPTRWCPWASSRWKRLSWTTTCQVCKATSPHAPSSSTTAMTTAPRPSSSPRRRAKRPSWTSSCCMGRTYTPKTMWGRKGWRKDKCTI